MCVEQRRLDKRPLVANTFGKSITEIAVQGVVYGMEIMTEYGRIHTDGSRSGGQPIVKTQHCPNCEAQAAEIERLRVEAQAQFDRGYYDGCANPIVRYDALRDALVDLLHAVCGKTGFAETVRRDSGRIYPWPALDLAEAKAIAALEQSK